ncbi:MAG: amino acid ABC transporter permease [Firmicutes bacterium]|nr:amino acid ABC transporter permease [Bacillota bacterium]
MGALDIVLDSLPSLLLGARVTLTLTGLAVLFGTIIGTFVGMARISKNKLIYGVATAYVEIIRGTPLLLQIYFCFFGLGQLGINLDEVTAAVVALAANCGGYTAEIVRAGIQAIPKGQMEAARSLGMTYSQAMRKVILPQAFRQMIPPMVNEFTAMLKDSSLVSILSITELMRAGVIVVTRTYQAIPLLSAVGVIYFIMTFILSQLANYLERRLRTGD